MCILLWTLPFCNHPRFKFAFASNRDEFMGREAARADFWDIPSVLKRANTPKQPNRGTCGVGILSGQDLQPSQAVNYVIQETETLPDGQEKTTLVLPTEDVPGTWLGITTHGDLVGLTNYRETMAYLAEKRSPKLSRGKVCGEYLIAMASAHENHYRRQQQQSMVSDNCDSSSSITAATGVPKDRAEQWIRKRAVGWDTEFEGLNLLVVQNAGDQQSVAGNREGSELFVFNETSRSNAAKVAIATSYDSDPLDNSNPTILPGSVVGVSNSVFKRPWTKVDIGVQALEKILNKSIELFGAGSKASLRESAASLIPSPSSNSPSIPSPPSTNDGRPIISNDDQKEIAWLVIQMLTLLRVNTKPFPDDRGEKDVLAKINGLRERVFIPKITLGITDSHDYDYARRSQTVLARNNESTPFLFKNKKARLLFVFVKPFIDS
ncbi:hypothetical protein BCR41DRAFT_203011 [Lobosporangium transversale]|uniref:NRDE protein-domain-containing protein n=1 Tax=Lobosporangium transversale TaxID=64571 RepID=A0A1Y2GWI2_9FUNG|nr:hypothetical protein BCR41DRAFT_203011 [Lobosporangium transversale]ORZ26627.1 hypothetical protein BCR41DRAFT_203011 [Lobosporangium transversale]|eukprot:XP_021884390.1 hypothetical protein BCR41DRAFT_203011 [Lobosporangium transversale]